MIRSRLFGVVVLLGVLLTPVPAAAEEEGPGYGGTAQAVAVSWQGDGGGKDGLALFTVGFQGGSPVALRIGAAADRTVYADDAGALRVLAVSAADIATARPAEGMTLMAVDAARFSTGLSVLAIGRDPAGGLRTLVGAVPPRVVGSWVRDVAPWGLLGLVLVGSGWMTRRARLAVRREAKR